MFDRYAYWSAHIAGGRNKINRPMGGSRSKRAFKIDDRIVLRLHDTDVITIYPDNSEVIYTGGWNTVTTRRFLSDHSAAHVWTTNDNLTVRVSDPALTAPKIQKCRTCHGTGEVPAECYGPWQRCSGGPTCDGPRYCFPAWQDCPHGETDSHLPDACAHGMAVAHTLGDCEHGQASRHRVGTCSHGETVRHKLPDDVCSRCDGDGRRDYGSNPIHYSWDGDPLRIDAHGQPIGPVAHPDPSPPSYATAYKSGGWNGASASYVAPTYVPTPAAPSYSDSGRRLAEALPAMDEHVVNPAPDGSDGPLSSVIIYLNDHARWTREQVADWLDTLGLDLSFPVPDDIPSHIR